MVEFFVAALVMLATARVVAEIFQRARQPALVGELAAGILIGPSLLNLIQPSSDLTTISNISLFFIMFLAGLNLQSREIVKATRSAVILVSLAFTIPFIAGYLITSYFGMGLVRALVVGLTLAVTAVPVNSIILIEFGLLKTRLGATVVTAGVINDIMSLLILGVILQLPSSGAASVDYLALGFAVLKIAAFVGGFMALDTFARTRSKWLRERFFPRFPRLATRESLFGVLLVFSIAVSLVAQAAGLNFVIGTFFAGLLLTDQIVSREALAKFNEALSGITFGFFAPLLFAYIGLEFDAGAVAGSIVLFTALLVAAIVTKVGAGFLGARLAGFSSLESRVIGYMMNSRGFIEIVVATTVLQAGLIGVTTFSVVVGIGAITTLIAPVAVRRVLRKRRIIEDEGRSTAINEALAEIPTRGGRGPQQSF